MIDCDGDRDIAYDDVHREDTYPFWEMSADFECWISIKVGQTFWNLSSAPCPRHLYLVVSRSKHRR